MTSLMFPKYFQIEVWSLMFEKNSDDLKVSDDPKVISNVTMNDAGEYKCQVENTNPKLEQVISKIIKCQCIHYTYPKLVFFLQFLGGFIGSKNISFYISQIKFEAKAV